LGLVHSEDFAPFFGVVDTVNRMGNDTNAASWTFDIGGVSKFRISADIAAMGDFETGRIEPPSQDAFVFDFAIDGGPFVVLFESSVDTAASQLYEMEEPHPDNPLITLDDPLSMNGVTLNNVFQTISAEVFGSGSELELRFRAIADGGEEAFAFRNLLVEAVDQGGSTDGGGDYNQNGHVEQGDLDLVLLNWGRADIPVDWTFDLPNGIIDQAELDGVLLNWGNLAGRSSPPAVPEPSSLAIAVLVLAMAGRATNPINPSYLWSPFAAFCFPRRGPAARCHRPRSR
jgi:hypothetical protein